MKPLPLLWCAFFPLAGIWASSEAFPWTPRAWEFQFSWSTVSYISEFLYKIRGFDLKSDTCVTMTSSSLLPSFPHTFTSFSLGTLLCTLHAQSSLCRVFFTRPCQWYKIYLQCIYINTNSSSPNIYISSKSRHFKSISFIFSYKPDFAYVYKLGVCFSLQVFFLLNHKRVLDLGLSTCSKYCLWVHLLCSFLERLFFSHYISPSVLCLLVNCRWLPHYISSTLWLLHSKSLGFCLGMSFTLSLPPASQGRGALSLSLFFSFHLFLLVGG